MKVGRQAARALISAQHQVRVVNQLAGARHVRLSSRVCVRDTPSGDGETAAEGVRAATERAGLDDGESFVARGARRRGVERARQELVLVDHIARGIGRSAADRRRRHVRDILAPSVKPALPHSTRVKMAADGAYSIELVR